MGFLMRNIFLVFTFILVFYFIFRIKIFLKQTKQIFLIFGKIYFFGTFEKEPPSDLFLISFF